MYVKALRFGDSLSTAKNVITSTILYMTMYNWFIIDDEG
jgi:hypothetical protein